MDLTGSEARRAQVSQIAENATRMAQVRVRVRTIGNGTEAIADLQNFGLTFVTMPAVTYGWAVAPVDDLDTEAVASTVMNGTGYVWQWNRDAKGYYAGAWVFVAFDSNYYPPSTEVVNTLDQIMIDHNFVFTGLAYKAFPDHLLSKL